MSRRVKGRDEWLDAAHDEFAKALLDYGHLMPSDRQAAALERAIEAYEQARLHTVRMQNIGRAEA
jgi:hypothetical protein